MAAVGRFCWALAAVALGCGKPVGFGGPVTPLAEIHVQTTGDLPQATGESRTPNPRFALVWGLQWMPEPFCFLPPESDAVAAVIQAGCRDNFGFVPNVVGADVPIEPGTPTTIPLINLPAADVMVGDVTARIAYASLVVYDDKNGNGALDLGQPQRQAGGGDNADAYVDTGDVVLGASFSSITRPDQRIAYIEGDSSKLANIAFYPRPGCPELAASLHEFWVFSAGGLSEASLVASLLSGFQALPSEPSCGVGSLDDTVVTVGLGNAQASPPPIPLDASPLDALDTLDASSSETVDATPGSPLDAGPVAGPDLSQLACTTGDTSGFTSYRGPLGSGGRGPFGPGGKQAVLPDLSDPNLFSACASFPSLPGDTASRPSGQQLVLAYRNRTCRTTLHYTLRGCRRDPACTTTEWDNTADPTVLNWWPCERPQ